MKKYKIIWDQKDYGHGATTHWDTVEAENEEQAISALRSCNCGVEEIFDITEV